MQQLPPERPVPITFISYAENFEDVMLWRALGGTSGDFYIDLGAHDPQQDSAENFAALRFNLEGFGAGRARLFHHALRSVDGEMPFHRDLENSGNFSLNLDAMRDRTFETVTVPVRDTAAWMEEAVPPGAPLIWKSDTQGYDEGIIARTPWSVWDRVECAIIELWRIRKPAFDHAAFRARIESFPHRAIGNAENISVDAVVEALSGNDWTFDDLILWR